MALETTAHHKAPSPAQAFLNELSVPTGMARTQFYAMGTTISLLLPEAQAQQGSHAVQTLFAEWENVLSRFRPESELSQLNQHAGNPVAVSPLLFHVVQSALGAARETAGLFDPSLLHQLEQLGYDRTFADVPAEIPEIPVSSYQRRAGGGWMFIQTNTARQEITLPQGIGIDLGGIAKGMAVDAAMEQLRSMNIPTALVNAGGDLAAMGTPSESDSWPIAIQAKSGYMVIPFLYGALATSGKAYRHWRQGQQERHHLLDPRSGEPAQSGLWTVTVAAARCEQAEVAAKVAFIQGEQQGKIFLERYGFAALLVREDGTWTTAGPWPVATMRIETTETQESAMNQEQKQHENNRKHVEGGNL